MKVELHCHSHYSKGSIIHCEGLNSPREIIKAAKKIGLGAVAITDHKVTDSWDPARKEAKKQGIIFIPGMEIQTIEGHIIGLGLNEPVKNYLSVEETVDIIHKQGGLSVAPHPFDILGKGIGDYIKEVDVVEVFSSLNLDISNHIARVKAKMLNKPFCVGSDAHTVEMLGKAINMVDADDVDSILKQIKNRNACFKTEYIEPKILVEWTRERFIRSYNDVVEYINKNYSFPRASLSKFLLDKFISSDIKLWDWIAKLSIDVVRMYSFLTMVKYY